MGESKTSPKKPKGSPLTPHRNGQWVKKFKGKLYYFGTWGDHAGAVSEWKAFEARHILGVSPDAGRIALADLVTLFLDAKADQVERGDLSPRSLKQYHDTMKWFVRALGRERPVQMLGPDDWSTLRKSFPATWGTVHAKNVIMHVRPVMKWGYDNGLLKHPCDSDPTGPRHRHSTA